MQAGQIRNQNQGQEGAVSKYWWCKREELSWNPRTREKAGFGDTLGMQEQEDPCSQMASQSSGISELQAKTHKTRWLAAAEWHPRLFSGLHMHAHTYTPAHTPTRKHIHIQKYTQIQTHLVASSKVKQTSTLRPRFLKLLKIHKRKKYAPPNKKPLGKDRTSLMKISPNYKLPRFSRREIHLTWSQNRILYNQ